MAVFSLLAVFLVGAAAPPPNAPKVSPEVKKKYKAALSRGRKLEKGKDYKGAVGAFQAALAVIPDDPWALSELGWAAYLAKDLTLAQQATRKAVAVNGAPNQKAASLYNLGMIEEALGHNQAAASALVESVRTSATRAARAELLKIDPAALAAIDPFAPQPMKGPFASLAEYCKTLHNRPQSDLECSCDWEEPAERIWDSAKANVVLEPPYQAARVFEDYECGDEPHANLALRLQNKWYVAPAVGFRNSGGACVNEFKVNELRYENGKRWLVLTAQQDSNCWLMNEDYNSEWTSTWITIVAIGPSGRPSATPRLTTLDDSEPDRGHGVALKVKFGDGSIEVTGYADKVDAGEVLGAHPLKFP